MLYAYMRKIAPKIELFGPRSKVFFLVLAPKIIVELDKKYYSVENNLHCRWRILEKLSCRM